MSEVSAATGKLLALSMLKGIGPATLRRMAARFDFLTASNQTLAREFPQNAGALQDASAWSRALEAAEEQTMKAQQMGVRILSAVDSEYPALLAATKDDPFLLWVLGNLAPTPRHSAAVIGTRQPTEHGQIITRRITRYFVEKQWSIVSGLALGCDAIAHQEAVDAGGHTVAVLAHGLHTVSPSRHRQLADDILAAGGALVSEYPLGHEVQRQQFVKRDRTQAGLAQGVVMVQSDLAGGSLHASRAALDYRRWLAVPYPTEVDRAQQEPKIQANLLLAEGSAEQRAQLLKCPPSALANVHILRSREDYALLTQSNADETPISPPSQGGLI